MNQLLPKVRELWEKVPSQVRSHAAVGFLCLVVGFMLHAGLFKPQPTVVTQVVTKTEYKEKEIASKTETTKKDETKDEAKVIDHWSTRVVTVEGKCEEQDHTHIEIGTKDHTTTDSTQNQHVEILKTGKEESKATQTVTPYQPQWRAGLVAAVELRHLDDVQLFGPLALGVQVEYRLGEIPLVKVPVWVGGIGLSSGTVGVTITGAF
jgi:hypothetical protein